MNVLLDIVLFSLLAGSSVFIGGVLSYFFDKFLKKGLLKKEILHTLVAFGAGIMLGAVCFVLIPEGIKSLSTISSILVFFLGTISFYFLDEYIKKKKTTASQLMAMLLDFIPESISLGAMFVLNHNIAILLAFFIFLQNLPESFNSYLELKEAKLSSKKALVILFLLSFIGVIFSLIGYVFLKDEVEITASIMIFSSAGILYLIFQDIAPALRIKENSYPVLGVNLGFLLALVCHLSI